MENKIDRSRWPQEDVAKLCELKEEGFSAKEIFEANELPGYSENAIQKMICRLGLSKKIKIFKFPMEINQRFKNYLRENWVGKTPEELSEIWSKENSKFPATKRKVVQYLTDMGLKVSYGEVQKIKNLRKKEQEIMQENFDSSTKMLEKLRMERIKLMRLRFEQNKNIWSGMEYKIKVNFG